MDFPFFKRMVTNMLTHNCAKLIYLQLINICTNFSCLSRYGRFQLDDIKKKLLISYKVRVFLARWTTCFLHALESCPYISVLCNKRINLHNFTIVRQNTHYYTNSCTQHFEMGLWGGWPGCPPRLFASTSVNPLTEAFALMQPPRLTGD